MPGVIYKAMFKLLLKFKGWEWALIAAAAGFVVLGVFFDLTLPDYLENISRVINGRAQGIPNAGTMGDIWRNGAIMLAFAVGSALTTAVVGLFAAILSSRHSMRVRKQVFEKVGNFGTAEMKKFSIASLITRSTNDITSVRMFIAMGLSVIIKAPITAVWAVLKITNKSWELSLVTLVAVLALMLLICVLLVVLLPKFKIIQKLTDNLNRAGRENLTGLRVVKAYNAEAFEEAKFGKANNELTRTNLVVNWSMGIFMPFMGLLMSGLNVAIYWVAAKLINGGSVTDPNFPNQVLVFSQYSFQIIMSFMMLTFVFIMLPRVVVSSRRINEVLDTKSSVTSGSGTSAPVRTNAHIEFKNVAFKYPDAQEAVVENINLSVKRGQTVAFIGSTGSGKSTVVNLLPRIYDATEGQVLLDGIDVKDYKLTELNDKIGYIPQTAVLFGGTIKSNVALGETGGHEISEDNVLRALEIAQAKDFVGKLSDGINSHVSQYGKNLSGGQKQRIAIARAIARNPEVLIFDDSFSALDYKTDRALRSAIKKEIKDTTVVIVAQRIGTIKDADVICVLDNGHMVGKGTHEQLMKTCKVYKEIALSQLTENELKGGNK